MLNLGALLTGVFMMLIEFQQINTHALKVHYVILGKKF